MLARRQSFDLPADPATGRPLDGIGLYRALRRVNPSPYLFFVRTPAFEVVGASPGAPPPGRGRPPDDPPDRRHAAARRRRPRGRAPRRAAPARPEGARRARDARRPRAQRPRPGRPAGHRDASASTWRSSATATSSTSCRTSRRGSGRSSDALDALRAVFPAGTLSGAPKVRAMQLIAAAEGERRGLYGGAVGYLGYDGNLDTAITIRSAVLKDGQAHVHTGAGIVAGSRPGARVRGDRAQGRGPAPGDRAGGRRARTRRPTPSRRRRRRAEPAGGAPP